MRLERIVPASERARRQLVRLVMAFYVALLGEGVLRKWVLPDASNLLVFLRDPIMILILVAYIRRGPSAVARVGLSILAFTLTALALCAAGQMATADLPFPVLIAGLRNYALFVPLSFVIRDCFTARDYGRWLKLNLALAPPVAVLVALQYGAPPSAPVNAVPGGGNEGVFLVVEDVVRPYGLFSFALGHSAYAAWMAGVVLAALIGKRRFGIASWLLAPGALGIVLMGALSGSRTCVLLEASVAACFVLVALACGPARTKSIALAATAAILAAAIGAMVLMPGVLADLATRQATAVASEGSTLDRVLDVTTGFLAEAGRVPLFGYGLGSGTNIGAFLATGSTDRVLAEYELTRIVQELGPLFGGLYIGLRWAFLAWLVLLTAAAARRGNLQPACFIGFLAPIFLAHDITLQNTMIGIGWFAAGILMNAARIGEELHPLPLARPVALCGAPA